VKEKILGEILRKKVRNTVLNSRKLSNSRRVLGRRFSTGGKKRMLGFEKERGALAKSGEGRTDRHDTAEWIWDRRKEFMGDAR